MGNSLFDILSGLEMGVSQADANIGKYMDLKTQQEESDLKQRLMEAQIEAIQSQPEKDNMDRLIKEEKEILKSAADEIRLIDQELKTIGFADATFSAPERQRIRMLKSRKRELLQFITEMSPVPLLSDEIDYEEEGYEE